MDKNQDLQEHRRKQPQAKKLSITWPIHFVDYRDTRDVFECPITLFDNSSSVHYHKRSIVEGRQWNDTTQWISTGTRIPLFDDSSRGYGTKNQVGVHHHHISYFVRTDIVEMLDTILHSKNLTLKDPIERVERSYDVAHLWPANGEKILRSQVSALLLDQVKNKTVFCGFTGAADERGRRGVSPSYVKMLLDTKIMVVVQRDNWEDHYRLFEAMVGGAMIMTDRMLSLSRGLQNGTSIVEFANPEELLQRLLYYLEHPAERREIAKRGRWVAMSQHRSWHRMEQIVFGRPVTLSGMTAHAV